MDNKRRITKAGLYALCFLLCSQIFGTLAVFLCVSTGLYAYSYDAAVLICSTAQYLGALPFCYLLVKKEEKCPLAKRKVKLSVLLGCLGLCSVMADIGYRLGSTGAGLITRILNIPVSDTMNQQVASTGVIANFFLLVLLAPILEEIIFRKILIDRTVTDKPVIAVFVSALLFGLIHCNIYQFFYATFIGFVLGIVYVKSGKLSYTIFLHSSFNLIYGFLPSTLQTLNVGAIPILTVSLASVCIFYLIGFSFLFKQAKTNNGYITSLFKGINDNLADIMLNKGILSAFIISSILYLIGLYL